ncbi:STAS domain-containing protein [Winogradskya humida]|uniref:Anti-anti-sigma factor n=1 Tax=Winogradskya humida TaxID=113566 RepID=A0ABQ4A7S9_9ACTN|nr:STAS domain-containing protein [Actinoplanes humidus]GIE26915.1 anti-anti-sigma factor [Actinoplanes humidus]
MSTDLTFTTGRHPDGAVVLAARGEIDMSNAAAFAAALNEAYEQDRNGTMVVDLTAVEYLDSAGLSALFPHVDHVRLIVTPLLAPVLTVVGLSDLTTVAG